MSGPRPHRRRSPTLGAKVVALSVSYQRDHLLARGLGLEHLQELVSRLVRPLLRRESPRCSIAYAGGWKETDDNFTHLLLRLISAEQEASSATRDNAAQVDASSGDRVPLINHSAWPHYLEVAPAVEAQWINACRLVRISQADAGLRPSEICPDAEAANPSPRALYAGAVALSAMRRKTFEQLSIPVPDAPPLSIPPADARIALGGKLSSFHGFIPGVLEEALIAMELRKPLYVLGGFGGEAELVARALLKGPDACPELQYSWLEERTPALTQITAYCQGRALPPGARTSHALLEAFRQQAAAPGSLAEKLRTGLSEDETRELLVTRDLDRAVRLVERGLASTLGF